MFLKMSLDTSSELQKLSALNCQAILGLEPPRRYFGQLSRGIELLPS